MNRTGIPYLDFTWNPGGFGCSAGCPGCWARRRLITDPALFPPDLRLRELPWRLTTKAR